MGPCQLSAIASTYDPAAAATSPYGNRHMPSTLRTVGTASARNSARNAVPTPASAPKWCVHFDGVSHSAAKASAVVDAESHRATGSCTRRIRAAAASTPNHTRLSRHSSTAARLA